MDQKGAAELKARLPAYTLNPAMLEVLELDELWTFVGKKDNPVWLWVALDRATRQVVAWVLGDRSEKTAWELWDALPLTDLERAGWAYCTDRWVSYDNVIPVERRATAKGETNHVERLNCTLRQRLGRLVRRTLSFSKSLEMLEAALTLFFHHYNASR